MTKQTSKLVKPLLSFVFWICVWQLAALILDKEIVLPQPLQVVKVWAKLAATSGFWLDTGLSILRVLFGLVIGILVGIGLALLAHRFYVADAIFSPFITIVRATPVASFIILLLVLMERSGIPTFVASLMVTPIVYANLRTGLSQIDRGLVEVTKVYGFSLRKRARYLYMPSVAPYLIASARTSLGLAWKAGIAAEVLCSTKQSIGKGILDAKNYLETDALFAWTLTVIVLSLLLEQGMLWLVKQVDSRMVRLKEREE